MTDHCDSLHAYVDGELDDRGTTTFEAHLATCSACTAELPRVLDLIAALEAASRAAPLPVRLSGLADARAGLLRLDDSHQPISPSVSVADLSARDVHAIGVRASAASARPGWRATDRRWLAAGGALAAAAAVLLLVIGHPVEQPPPPSRPAPLAALDAAIGPTRRIEARVSLPGADRYRPIDVPRGGTDSASEALLQLERDLEQARDWHAAAVVALLAGDRAHAARAFARAPASPDLDSDRAAFELLDGSPPALERALDNVDHALAAAPRSAAAHWNRGLVLAAMQLPMAAALEFDAVHALGEPGWAGDAQRRAAELRAQVVQRRTRWKQAFTSGQRMIADGTPAPAELVDVSGTMTYMLYDAVRAAPSRERVLALLPVARALDEGYRSTRLSDYVQRIASSDFRVRKPLADRYRELALGRLTAEATAALLAQVTRRGAEDLRMGALVYASRVGAEIDDYRKLVSATADPWFTVIAEQAAATTEIARGDTASGEHRLREALALARRERLTYRAIRLENDLVQLHKSALDLSQAATIARSAYRDAITASEWVLEMGALNDLAAIHHNRYAAPIARAYLTELAERADHNLATGDDAYSHLDCIRRLYAYQSLSNISLMQLDAERARAELARAPRCNLDPTNEAHAAVMLRDALTRSFLYRADHRREDAELAQSSVAALRASPSIKMDGQDAFLAYIEGALTIKDMPPAGRQALHDAITRAGQAPGEFNVKARAYSFSLLAIDAGQTGAFNEVVSVIAENLDIRRPARCALAAAVDREHLVVAYLDPQGAAGGTFSLRKSGPLDAQGLVPATVNARLRGCDRVTVLARPPVLGAPRLLPPDVVWSYLLTSAATPIAMQSGVPVHRLVVANPEAPPELGLPALERYPATSHSAETTILRGADATPSRILRAMTDASIIEFHTHGFATDDLFEASHIVLSPELDGHYTLTARDITRTHLRASPVVILGACHAAASSGALESSGGLPEAFLRAGARAVIASPDAIQDHAAYPFFSAIRARIEAGDDPATALRDERMRHLASHPDDDWVSGVVIFQ